MSIIVAQKVSASYFVDPTIFFQPIWTQVFLRAYG